jgi:hypothetical protein
VGVHIRSIFLQGLLLMQAVQRPGWFQSWGKLLDGWLQWCASERLPPLQAALGFTQSLPGIERTVVGVDSVMHLGEILTASRGVGTQPPDELCSEDVNLIDPSRWKLT